MGLREFFRELETVLPVPRYNLVQAKNLTPDELDRSKLPNRSLSNVIVNFQSPAGVSYKTLHTYRPGRGPSYLLLTSRDRDKEDFNNVAETVAQIVEGVKQKLIISREEDICQAIIMAKSPTQQQVAESVRRYMEGFREVIISYICYRGVPIWAYQKSGLPAEKLSFRND